MTRLVDVEPMRHVPAKGGLPGRLDVAVQHVHGLVDVLVADVPTSKTETMSRFTSDDIREEESSPDASGEGPARWLLPERCLEDLPSCLPEHEPRPLPRFSGDKHPTASPRLPPSSPVSARSSEPPLSTRFAVVFKQLRGGEQGGLGRRQFSPFRAYRPVAERSGEPPSSR